MRTIKQVNTLNFAKPKNLHPTLAAKNHVRPVQSTDITHRAIHQVAKHCGGDFVAPVGIGDSVFRHKKVGGKHVQNIRLERFGNRGTNGRMPENDTHLQSYYIK